MATLDPVTACLIAAVMVGVIVIVVQRMKSKTAPIPTTSKTFAKRKLLGKVSKAKTTGMGSGARPKLGSTSGIYGVGGGGMSGFNAEAYKGGGISATPTALDATGMGEHPSTYNYHANAREMFAGTGMMPPAIAATPNQSAQWIQAQAAARASAEPRTSLDSQLTAPVVSSLDPQSMTENPLDPYLENITFHLTAFKNRNTNFDPRGQPAFDTNFLTGTDQLVNIRNVERLAYHGPGHQITGCSAAAPPRY